MSDTTKHHPSCKPNDRALIFKCSQCGLEESATHLEDIRADLANTQRDFEAARDALDKFKKHHEVIDTELYEEMDMWRARATRAEGALQQERAEKKLTQDKLAQMVRERDSLQLKMDLGG